MNFLTGFYNGNSKVNAPGKSSTAIALLASLSLLNLQGCVSTDKERTQAEGAAAGATIGALAGLVFGDSKEAALIGAGLGFIAGHMYGKHVSDNKEKYADKESYMEAMIAESDKVLAVAREQRTRLKQNLTQQQKRLTEIAAMQKQEKNANQLIAEQIKQNQQDLEVANQLIAAIDWEINTQRRVVEEERNEVTVSLVSLSEANISSMESEKRQLELLKAQLVSLDRKRVY